MRKLVLIHSSNQEEPLRGISNTDMVYVSFHLDNSLLYNIEPKYKYLKLDRLLEFCKKYQDENLDTIIMKNFSMLKIYLRWILKETLDPLAVSGVIDTNTTIIIDGLDRIYDDVISCIVEVGTDLSKYIRHEFNILTDIRIIIKEEERF